MARLTQDDIRKLARLARLDLTDAELDEYAREIEAIIGYVDQLQAVEVGDLKPTNQVNGLVNVMRDDEIRGYGYAPKELLKNVPEVEDDQIKVNRMVG